MRLAVTVRTYLRDVGLNSLAASFLMPRTGRYAIYRVSGLRLGTRNISSNCFVSGANLSIGRKCFINYGCFFDATAPILIGEGSHIGMRTVICTSSHELGGPSQRAGALRAAPVRIGRGVWLGAHVTVLPGVTIGDGCVVAAGSVVTQDCRPDCIYAGNPARLVREISSDTDTVVARLG
jgi:maltose O-acetyltransferase